MGFQRTENSLSALRAVGGTARVLARMTSENSGDDQTPEGLRRTAAALDTGHLPREPIDFRAHALALRDAVETRSLDNAHARARHLAWAADGLLSCQYDPTDYDPAAWAMPEQAERAAREAAEQATALRPPEPDLEFDELDPATQASVREIGKPGALVSTAVGRVRAPADAPAEPAPAADPPLPKPRRRR